MQRHPSFQRSQQRERQETMSACVDSVSEFEQISQLPIFAYLYLFETIDCPVFL